MPKVIGLLCALIALAGSILAKADPTTSLIRAAVAFAIGVLLTQIWYAWFAVRFGGKREEPRVSYQENDPNVEDDNRAA